MPDFDRRLLHGGLPEPLLAARKDAPFFSEWIDSFYARDILELFGIRNRQGFLSLFRLLLRWSGGQVDYSRLARLSELSRPTVKAHVEALQILNPPGAAHHCRSSLDDAWSAAYGAAYASVCGQVGSRTPRSIVQKRT